MSSPKLSVIIPVYNDPEGLKDTLDGLVHQDMDESEYEVLVVDNNSTDDTSKVIESYSSKYRNIIGLKENRIQSSYAARNRGIKHSEGELVSFIDADMWMEEDYLKKVRRFFQENPGLDYMGCKVEMMNNSGNLTARYNERNGFPVEKYLNTKNFVPTCCLSVRREVFSEVGLFNENLVSGGDKLFGKKVFEAGLEIKYTDDIKLFHPVRDRWSQIASKYFRMGRGWYQKKALGEDMSDEEVKITEGVPIFLKILRSAGRDLVKKKGDLTEVTVFTWLDFLKKGSMFAGYQYQRLVNLTGKRPSIR